MAHHLETVLEAAKRLRHEKDIVFLIVGDGAEHSRLLALKNEMGLENIVFLGQQGKDRMPGLWALSDASLVLLRKSDLVKTVILSKIFESMAMRKPIVLGVEGESRQMIEKAGAGLCIEPEDAKALAQKVLELARRPELGEALGTRGRQYVEEHFDRNRLADRYASILKAVVDRKSRKLIKDSYGIH